MNVWPRTSGCAPVELFHAADPLLDDELRFPEHMVRGGALQLRGLVCLLVDFSIKAIQACQSCGCFIPVAQLQIGECVPEPVVMICRRWVCVACFAILAFVCKSSIAPARVWEVEYEPKHSYTMTIVNEARCSMLSREEGIEAHLDFQSPSARSSSLTARYRSAKAWKVRVSSGNRMTCDSSRGTPMCQAQWFLAMHLVSSAGSFGCGWHIWTLCISTLTDFVWLTACMKPRVTPTSNSDWGCQSCHWQQRGSPTAGTHMHTPLFVTIHVRAPYSCPRMNTPSQQGLRGHCAHKHTPRYISFYVRYIS